MRIWFSEGKFNNSAFPQITGPCGGRKLSESTLCTSHRHSKAWRILHLDSPPHGARADRKVLAAAVDSKKTAILQEIQRDRRATQGHKQAVREGLISVHDNVRESILWEEDSVLQKALDQARDRITSWANMK